jgi:hypothetical protein
MLSNGIVQHILTNCCTLHALLYKQTMALLILVIAEEFSWAGVSVLSIMMVLIATWYFNIVSIIAKVCLLIAPVF